MESKCQEKISIMGVLNATPDSFSDGGTFLQPEQAFSHVQSLVEGGADWIDLGGASSHPKGKAVTPEDELMRVLPVLKRILPGLQVPVSIDTQQPFVARACLEAGAQMINDVSGLESDEMALLAGAFDVPLVIMHNGFRVPPEKDASPLMERLLLFFREQIAKATAAGAKKIILDPGYGFGKTLEENMILLKQLPVLNQLGYPLLVCTSRKGSLGKLTGEAIPVNRLAGTLASSLYAVKNGASMIRVHDVKAFHQALSTWQAIESAPENFSLK